MCPNTEDKFGKNFYWSDEAPVYNDEISTLGIRKFECNREVKKYFNYINY